MREPRPRTSLSAHRRYLGYVLRHKWHVYRAGRQLGVGRWQLLVHDLSKFSRAEWSPYVRFFYTDTPDKATFEVAWLHHQHANPHHWQHWVLRNDNGITNAVQLPEKYAREMVADWRGAGLALGKPDTRGWYEANRERIVLHEATQRAVECLLAALDTAEAA